MKIIELGESLGLYVKVVTSINTFDNYNSFFNIYDESEEPCRRILLLTPYSDLEEVYDNSPSEAIKPYKIIENNILIEEYPLTTNPKNIIVNDIEIDNKLVDEIIYNYKNKN